METCVRGFSFMPETKVENIDMQYIESGELERTWKTTRRQRLKEQEQKVWDEFVQEKDVVKSICKDNPYQFLHQLPESCLQELMEAELQKTRKEVEQEEIVEQPAQGDGDHQLEDIQHVTFAEEQDRDDCDMFHIFDDDKDDPSGPSGPEDEALNGSQSSPCTVREKDDESSSPVPLGKDESVENVSNVIESSIYCAKVKDLRIKINEEMLAIIASLDRQDVMTIEREEVSRICRISAEFSSRFNRIYMYQLQRQMQDLSRNTKRALPFARHTHFHAQMVRVTSLHHNLLQALQVFHKSMSTTACLKQSAGILHALGAAARDLSSLCAATPAPPAMSHVARLYSDEMLSSCDKLDEAVCEYSVRVADFLTTTDTNTSRSPSRRSKGKGRKRGPVSKSTKSVPDTEARLSMYSLDTIRLNLNTKSSSSKDNQSSGTSKMLYVPSSVDEKSQIKTEPQTKSPKKSPRSRRPLMRAGDGGSRRARPLKDSEITTMVEAVGTCTSSHISREVSPHSTPRRRTVNNTPRTGRLNTPVRRPQSTYRQKIRTQSPKAKVRRGSPKAPLLKALDNIKSAHETDTNRSEITTKTYVKDFAAVKNIGDITQNSKHAEKSDKPNTDNHNFEKGNLLFDKKDKFFGKAGKDASSGRDCDSFGDYGSKSINGEKDFDGWKDFGNNDFDSKSGGTVRDMATCTKTLGTGHKDSARRPKESPRPGKDEEKDVSWIVRDKKVSSTAPARCEVTRLLKQLCSGDTSVNRNETVSGARNAQLLCVSGGSPRPPSTPQLLRILEETIQKKAPKPMYQKQNRDPDRFRMTFNIADKTADSMFQYRTKFVQHMLASPMYANSAVGKPWEMVGSVSDKIIDEVLWGCSKEMQIRDVVQDLYLCETN